MRFHLAVITLFSAGSLAAGTITTYTDQAAFLAAAQAIPNTSTELETFDSPGIAAPDLAVQTWTDWPGHRGQPGYGHVADGLWLDCVGKACDTVTDSYTKWIFGKPAYAFGATFNYGGFVDLPGALGISFNYGMVGAPLTNGFFGFTSTDPLSSITVTNNAWRNFPLDFPDLWIRNSQPYIMDNLYIQVDSPGSPAPEPASWAFMLFGTFGLVLGRKFLRPAANAPNLCPERQAIH